MKIYLASNYTSHPYMREVAASLTDLGHEITSEWIQGTHSSHDHAGYAAIDLRDIDAADALIFFSQDFEGSRTRGGKHVEFGYALAKNKLVCVVGERKNVFHWMPSVVIFNDFSACVEGFRMEIAK
jgi:nucleoside 2-deoxyribosyltransferase